MSATLGPTTAAIAIAPGPFLLGAAYDDLDPAIRAADRRKALGLGAVLASTPPHWVDLPAFSIQARMVTNGDYHAFWMAPHPSQPGRRLVDDAEIWQFAWEQHGLATVRVPASEPGVNLVEDYVGCPDAIDALLTSYAWEAQRLILGHHVPSGESGFDDRSRALVRLFSGLRASVAQAMGGDLDHLTPAQRRSAAEATDTTRLMEDLGAISAVVEERLFSAAARAPLAILLRRVARWLAAGGRVLLPSDLFQPLAWPDDLDKALKEGRGLFRTAVPFADLPVTGVSIYEAGAYAAWLSLHTGRTWALPSEAEYEKAFGWPLGCTELDPRRKHIFPWQGHSPHDYNQWFSREGHRVEQLQKRAQAWQRLVEDTARPLGAERLLQGLGFGWQWTRERFNELERKYNRFTHVGWLSRQVGGRTVHEYRDQADQACRYFVARGAPDQLGGPGTVTRRFALSPLRGYVDCGFRCVSPEEGA